MGSSNSTEGTTEVRDQIVVSQKKWSTAPPMEKSVSSPTCQETPKSDLEEMQPAGDEGYIEWLKEFELKNAELYESTKANYTTKANQLAERFQYVHKEPLCDLARREVQKCYADNLKQPLNCAGEVHYFKDCIQQAQFHFRRADTRPKEAAT